MGTVLNALIFVNPPCQGLVEHAAFLISGFRVCCLGLSDCTPVGVGQETEATWLETAETKLSLLASLNYPKPPALNHVP